MLLPAFALLDGARAQADQDGVQLNFQPIFKGQPLELTKTMGDGFGSTITTLRCYLSGFKLLEQGEIVWTELESYHLLDVTDPTTLNVVLHVPSDLKFDVIQCNLGIDSLTSVSGAYGGDLDPTNGMYWAWNSGYINFKLEGTDPICSAKGNAFEFHLGGYMPPNATCLPLAFNCRNSRSVNVIIDLDSFLSSVDLTKDFRVMSPGKEAVRLSNVATSIFSCDAE